MNRWLFFVCTTYIAIQFALVFNAINWVVGIILCNFAQNFPQRWRNFFPEQFSTRRCLIKNPMNYFAVSYYMDVSYKLETFTMWTLVGSRFHALFSKLDFFPCNTLDRGTSAAMRKPKWCSVYPNTLSQSFAMHRLDVIWCSFLQKCGFDSHI